MRMPVWLGLGLALTILPTRAHATWSIAAVDPRTQEVGVAVASCVPAPFGSTILPSVGGLAPGIGALAAQAQFSQQTRDLALELLSGGASPQAVIDEVVAADGLSAVRQYGVTTLDGMAAGFTGASTQDWAGDVQGFGVSAQGNILYGPEVVDDSLTAFEAKATECPLTLADRLMLALEAGAAQGGDNRCSEEQTALAAVLQVAQPGDDPGAPSLDLRIPSQAEGGDNPVVLLRAAYDQWRLDNPPDASGCDAGTGTGTGGMMDTGAADETGGGSSGDGPSGQDSTGDIPPASGSDTGPLPEATAGPSGSDDTAGGQDGDGGCGCRTERSGGSALGLLALVWLARGRRRRRRRRSPSA